MYRLFIILLLTISLSACSATNKLINISKSQALGFIVGMMVSL